MTETVADALERYRELKETFNQDLTEMKGNVSGIKSEVTILRDILSEFKVDVKSIMKDFEWINKRSDEIKKASEKLAEEVSNCPFCNSSINIEALNVKANRALTIATISISLNLALLALLAAHIFQQKGG
jgi:chromosome segregation ATPase